MPKPSDTELDWDEQRNRIVGLGQRSVHKSYYPALRRQMADLQRLMAAVDQTTAGIIICDRDGVIEFANPAQSAITGYANQDLLGRKPNLFRSLATQETVYAELWQTILSGRPWHGDLLNRRPDGQTYWSRLSIAPVRDDSGKITHYIGINEDISAIKQAEEDRMLSARTFGAICEGILIFDESRTIVMVNEAFERITGYGRNETVGQPVSMLTDEEATDGHLWQVLETRRQWQGELPAKRKNGEEYWAELSITPIEDDTGRNRHYVAVFSDITRRKVSEARIEHMAYHDVLTDLPNRLLLADRFQQALAGAQRRGSGFALMFLDLDRFKNVNDILGHSVGDLLLTQVAERLKALLRATDTVSRQGGDEFIVLLGDTDDLQQIATVARKILTVLGETYHIGGHELSVTPSIGVAIFPEDGRDLDTLLRHADAAMYHSKRTGGNAVQFFRSEMNRDTLQFFSLENGLRHALARNELSLHYQPLVDLSTGRWDGVEALLRWNSRELGTITPDKFIPVAEETGLILSIGNWVLEQACRQAVALQKSQGRPIRVAVNISGAQFRKGGLVEEVEMALASTGLAAHLLELEVTESVLMSDAVDAEGILRRLHNCGVHLAIDDFGTGYSSLAYLKRFPVDRLKIDKSFVQDLTVDANDARICGAVINLAANFQLKVVAEGIETEQQRDWLREAGCHFGQGYFFSRPKPPAELAACDPFLRPAAN